MTDGMKFTPSGPVLDAVMDAPLPRLRSAVCAVLNELCRPVPERGTLSLEEHTALKMAGFFSNAVLEILARELEMQQTPAEPA